MQATAAPAEGNKVCLSINVDESEIDGALDSVVKTLGRQIRVPGFRPGKVPRRVLEARMGGPVALRAEALREALPDFYSMAVTETEIDPIAQPEIDITSGAESGPVVFEAVVEVRPSVAIPGYAGLVVTLPSITASDEEVAAQIDRLRDTDAELVVADRAAADGDQVTISLYGNDDTGKEIIARDEMLYEVGRATLVAELDDHLRGAKVGDILIFTATPAGGTPIDFKVMLKQVQSKKLPELTDAWVAENSEFDSVAKLETELRAQIDRVKLVQAQMAWRESSLGALADLVDPEEVPASLVDDEVHERVHDLGHRLQSQGLTVDQFLQVTGRNGEDVLAELRVEAARSVRMDLGLRALADAENLTVDAEELAAEIAAMAERMETTAEELREQLDRNGRTIAVRSELRKNKALTWLLDHIELVDENNVSIDRARLRVDQSQSEIDGVAEESDQVIDASADAEEAPANEEVAGEEAQV